MNRIRGLSCSVYCLSVYGLWFSTRTRMSRNLKKYFKVSFFRSFPSITKTSISKNAKRWKQNLSKINIWLVTSGFIVLMSVISQPIISFGSLCFFGYGSKRSKTDVSIYLITKWSWRIDYTFFGVVFWMIGDQSSISCLALLRSDGDFDKSLITSTHLLMT